MRNMLLFAVLAILQTVEVRAQVPDGMTEDFFLEQAENDKRLQQDMLDRLELLDVNLDKAISATEMEEMVKGTEIVDRLTEDEKKETADKIKEYFKQADLDKDDMLRGDEINEFGKLMQVFMLKLQFKKMDRNGDGVYNLADVPPMEESMKMLEEAMQKMQETVEKVNAMDENELASNFMQSVTSSMAKEDYMQMDKNHDNCVTKDEYADYHMATQEIKQEEAETPENEKIILSREAYLSLYTREKKANPACLTMEEYVANQSKIFENMDEDDAEIGTLIFAEMDANQDGKVTQDEFVTYNMSTNSEERLKEDDFINMFKNTKGAEKGWLTKDEYVADYVAIGADIKNELNKN